MKGGVALVFIGVLTPPALGFSLAPCGATSHALVRPSLARSSSPLLMGKGRKRKKKPAATSASASQQQQQQQQQPPSPQAQAAAQVPDQPLMAIPPPQVPDEPLMAIPPPTSVPSTEASAGVSPPPPLPTAFDDAMATPLGGMPEGFVPPPPRPQEDIDDLPPIEPLAIADEPKLSLPSFGEYKLGPPKAPPPETGGSKLPKINQGRSYADELLKKEEKPFMERLVFGLAWAGIFFLIAVEIFINSPAFPVVKPIILNFLGDGTDYNDASL